MDQRGASTIGDRNGEANVLSQLAKLERSRGNLIESRKLIEDAVATIESLRVNLKVTVLLGGLHDPGRVAVMF